MYHFLKTIPFQEVIFQRGLFILDRNIYQWPYCKSVSILNWTLINVMQTHTWCDHATLHKNNKPRKVESQSVIGVTKKKMFLPFSNLSFWLTRSNSRIISRKLFHPKKWWFFPMTILQICEHFNFYSYQMLYTPFKAETFFNDGVCEALEMESVQCGIIKQNQTLM